LNVVIILTLALASTVAAIVDLDASGVTDTDGPRDGVYLPGNSISLSWLVYNLGDETSADYSIEFFIGDYSIGSESGSGIESGSNDYDTGKPRAEQGIPSVEVQQSALISGYDLSLVVGIWRVVMRIVTSTRGRGKLISL